MSEFDSLFDMDITFSGEKGDKGKDGRDGKPGHDGVDGGDGIDGKNGLDGSNGKDGKNGKDGLNGKDGKNGVDGKSIKGVDGTDGNSAYEVWLLEENEGTEQEFLDSLKGKDADQHHWTGNAYTELAEMEDTDIPLTVKGDLLANDGTRWVNVGVGSDSEFLVANSAAAAGVSWQAEGYGFLTDESGNILTDQAGNALEGKNPVAANLQINDYTQAFLLMGG